MQLFNVNRNEACSYTLRKGLCKLGLNKKIFYILAILDRLLIINCSESDDSQYWVDWFLGLKGNEFFCEVDEDFIQDRFNLTGLSHEVPHYSQSLDLILDVLDPDLPEEVQDEVEASARHLYGLIHARYILTAQGLYKMVSNYVCKLLVSCF